MMTNNGLLLLLKISQREKLMRKLVIIVVDIISLTAIIAAPVLFYLFYKYMSEIYIAKYILISIFIDAFLFGLSLLWFGFRNLAITNKMGIFISKNLKTFFFSLPLIYIGIKIILYFILL